MISCGCFASHSFGRRVRHRTQVNQPGLLRLSVHLCPPVNEHKIISPKRMRNSVRSHRKQGPASIGAETVPEVNEPPAAEIRRRQRPA